MKAGKNEIPVWVFASSVGPPIDRHKVERREFEKCLQLAGLRRVRFPDLWHPTASLSIQDGAPLAYVKDALGHSSAKVAVDIYGHFAPGANRQEMNRLPSLKSAISAQQENQAAISGGRCRI